MKLDTLLRLHVDAARQTVQEAQPPHLDRIKGSARRSRRLSIGVAVVAAAVAAVVVLLLVGPTTDLTPTTAIPATQSSSTTVANNSEDSGVVVTTIAVPSDLEQAGVDLQDAILADGDVSRVEFEQAVDAMAACMKGHGLTGVTWSVRDDGGWSSGYNSSEGIDEQAAEDAIYNLCYYSYVDRLSLPPIAEPGTATAGSLPYLGLDLPGWEFVQAGEAQTWCSDQVDPMPGTTRQAVYTYDDAPSSTLLGVRRVNVNVLPASTRCSFQEIPTNASDLGPPAAPPDVIDHGMTAVMGQRARIVEEQGSFRVMWLVGADGSAAGIDVFPGSTPLTVDDVVSIAAGIVQLTQAEWLALVENSPTAPAVTIP
ncbi:MAG: hypothetical protein V3U50_05300 [Acidimicrobiia bacterium]